MQVEATDFGKTVNGEPAKLWTVSNAAGAELSVTNVGACIVAIRVPDARGILTDVVLGYDDAAGYSRNNTHFGAPMGRVVNRIGGASFTLDGVTYDLDKNEGANCNHSGNDPWRERMWDLVRAEQGANGGVIELALFSPDGDQGFPGAVHMHVTYELTGAGDVVATYDGTPTARTLVNMTNHSYFNLNGQASGSAMAHRLTVDACAYTQTGDDLVPTGRILPLDGTPLDLREGHELADVVSSTEHSIVNARGIDHNFVLAEAEPAEPAEAGPVEPTVPAEDGFVGALRHVAKLEADESGIVLDVSSDLPGMQVYTANYVEGVRGKGGVTYHDHDAVCLETNFFADAIHHPNFAQPVFGPDRPYRSRTVYAFSTQSK